MSTRVKRPNSSPKSTEPSAADKASRKAQAIGHVIELIANAGGPNEEKLKALKSLLDKVYEDVELAGCPKIRGEVANSIVLAIEELEDEEPMSPSMAASPSQLFTGSDGSFISKKEVYNPVDQVVTPKAMIKWQAMQILNMYFWFNMPCVVMIDYDCGMIVRTQDIDYDYIYTMVNSDFSDVVMFTDGKRSTVLKDR